MLRKIGRLRAGDRTRAGEPVKGSISAPSAAASRRLRSETRPAGRSPHTLPSLRWAGVQTTKPVGSHRKKHHPSGWCQRVDKPTPLSFRGAKRRGNPYLFRQKPAKSAGIMRFGNGLLRQCVPQGHLLRGADWLAMTGFFDSLRNTIRQDGVFFLECRRRVIERERGIAAHLRRSS